LASRLEPKPDFALGATWVCFRVVILMSWRRGEACAQRPGYRNPAGRVFRAGIRNRRSDQIRARHAITRPPPGPPVQVIDRSWQSSDPQVLELYFLKVMLQNDWTR